MRFTKMQGAGNDYVYVNCFAESPPADPVGLAIAVSDRHKGVGADGLILICPSEVADARMRMWNADGSPAEMCGNGVRCVAKYMYDHGISAKEELKIETGNGVRDLQLQVSNGKVDQVRVNMGAPILEGPRIPTTLPGNPPLRVKLALGNSSESGEPPLPVAVQELEVTCVSMGNPHCVTFVDEVNDEWVLGVGPQVERHGAFPNRVNAEFVQVLSPREILVRVWERGSGETQACGTGACAAMVAGVLTGLTHREVLCHLPGGDLKLQWANSGEVYLTGPATEVFSGDWPLGA
jgi:diaminopimelate epimerase